TRFANNCLSVPFRSTPIGLEQVTVPEIRATPVRLLALPVPAIVTPSCSGAKTCTAKLPVATLPERSVAVQSTVVVPTGKNEPGAGGQLTDGLGARSSLADA